MIDTTIPRPPWLGLVALATASGMWAAVWFSTTPQGQHWIEDQLRPWGHAAILAWLLGIVLFFGTGFLVFALAVSAAWRREPFRLGEVAFAIYFIYFLIHEITALNFLAIPFLTLFAGGFTYVALCSLAQWFPQLRNPWRDSGDALSA